jgi:hypothetical protein
LENDLVELLDASVNGTLDKIELKWKPEASVCVVMASGGYPGNYAKGKVIRGLDDAAKLPGVKVFHAGTALKGRANRHERRTRSRRDGAGQRFESRASRRLCRRGKNPFRRRAVPPRHRGKGQTGPPLQPDIVVACLSGGRKRFMENPYAATDANQCRGFRTNRFLPFVDHTSEADLVRAKIKDGDQDENPSRSRTDAEPQKPQVIRDPVLARAVDLIKGLAVVRASRS